MLKGKDRFSRWIESCGYRILCNKGERQTMKTNRMRRFLAVACMSLFLAGSSLMVVYGENTAEEPNVSSGSSQESSVEESTQPTVTPTPEPVESSESSVQPQETPTPEPPTPEETPTPNETPSPTPTPTKAPDDALDGEGGTGGTTGGQSDTGDEGGTSYYESSDEPVYYPEAGDTPVDPDDESSYYTGSNTFQDDDNSDLVDDASVIEELPVSALESSEESSEAVAAVDGESSVKFGNNGGSSTLFWTGLILILLGVVGIGSVIWMQVSPRLKARKAAAKGLPMSEEALEDMEDINSFSQDAQGEENQEQETDESVEPQAPADPKADTIDLDALMK